MKLSLRRRTAIFMGGIIILYCLAIFALYSYFEQQARNRQAVMSAEDVAALLKHYGMVYSIVSVCLMLVLAAACMILVDRMIVSPINRMASVASSYSVFSETEGEMELGEIERNDFAALDIKTGDEIEALSEAMKKMERDLNEQVENLFATKQELLSTREHAAIMFEEANRDALTGIRNKRSYDAEVARINERIMSGRDKIGIVMVDMNDLKTINDTYGHEKGDRVICNLCDTLCSIFKRSPVFRVGGDEFVVVTENRDLQNIEKNVEQFRACVERSLKEEELEPWERTSAAIGYAIYDRDSDCGIEDTLKRADENMYEYKRMMKAEEEDDLR
ncbi:MAG: diguanylate cyclase [Lachnospiraceae bacterium]|nr:diguanylate cyclase [Lachnospiraceae bacterium]